MTISQLPFPRHIGIKHQKQYTLNETLYLEQWQIPAGTVVKVFQSTNFGYCIIPHATQDVRGFTIQRRVFRY
jgi:hypothetical protein